MLRVLLPVCVVACNTSAQTRPSPSPLPINAATPFVDDVIVIEASGIVGHYQAPIRALRRIVAARHGKVEVTPGFGEVTLIVTSVVSGKLFDPEYAKRPLAANHLEVVLVDDAGHFARTDTDAYKGTWRLTQLADGTLVAASLADTPLTQIGVAWRAWVTSTRADLRAPTVDRRIAGLTALLDHHAYELVPDVIALLDDKRPIPEDLDEGEAPRIGTVFDLADRVLEGYAGAIGEDDPSDGRSIDAWAKLWAERFTQVDPLPVVVPSTATEHVRVSSHQTWPEIAVSDSGVVVGVTYLEHKLDGDAAGIFVPAGATRRWITREMFERLQVSGAGMVWADTQSRWHFATTTGAKAALPKQVAKGQWATIATASDGFLVLGVDKAKRVHAIELAANGKQRRTARLALPAAVGSHVEKIFVAPRAGGWLAVAQTDQGIAAVAIDGALRVRKATNLSPRGVPATIAVGRDRALAAWHVGVDIESVVTDLEGKPVGALTVTGDSVSEMSAPIALDDGFALAWIEAGGELHVGRFDRDGMVVSNVVVQANHVAPFSTVHLARDQAALLVTFLDVSRYPYAVVTRRL